MQFSTAKALVLMILPLVISAVSTYPVSASNIPESESSLLLSQNANVGELSGEIASISGETVAITQSNGQNASVTIPQSEINRLNLRPGTRISVTVNEQGVATSVRILAVRALW